MNKVVELGTLISTAKTVRCGTGKYPVLSMTMHDGLVFQDEKFKKVIASKDTSDYKIVYRNQLVISFPIDEGVLATQRITDAGIVSPAYGIWDVDQSQIYPEYLEYALRSNRALQYYKAKLRGSTARRRSLPTPTLLAFTIPLPTLKKQNNILDYIARVKSVIEKRKKQIIELDNLVKARFVEMFGDPIRNTKNLPIRRLGDLGLWNSGGTPSRSNTDYFCGTINWYSAGELNSLYLHGSNEKITEEAIESSAAKLFKSGSMLVGMYDTAAFKMGILTEDSASNQACACIEPHDSIDIVWLYYALTLMRDTFLSQRRGVRQKNLNLGMIRNFTLPTGYIDDQKQFADFVRQVDKSKVAIQKSLDETQLLFDSLMQKYFG